MPSPTRRRIKEIAYTYQDLLRKHKGYPVRCFKRDPTKSPFWKSFVKLFLLANYFGVEPRYWLETQFRRFPIPRSCPLPTMMCSEAAINHFISENPKKLSFTKEDSRRILEIYEEVLSKLSSKEVR